MTAAAPHLLTQTDPMMDRQRERRRGSMDLISAVAEATADRADPSRPRAALEEAMCRLLPLDTVHVRGQGLAGLESTLASGAAADAWTSQLLDCSAHLAVIVLELERSRHQLMRT